MNWKHCMHIQLFYRFIIQLMPFYPCFPSSLGTCYILTSSRCAFFLIKRYLKIAHLLCYIFKSTYILALKYVFFFFLNSLLYFFSIELDHKIKIAEIVGCSNYASFTLPVEIAGCAGETVRIFWDMEFVKIIIVLLLPF